MKNCSQYKFFFLGLDSQDDTHKFVLFLLRLATLYIFLNEFYTLEYKNLVVQE